MKNLFIVFSPILAVILLLSNGCLADSDTPQSCDFDVLGLRLGMSKDEFISKAKGAGPAQNRFENFSVMERRSYPPCALIIQDSTMKITDTKLRAFVVNATYGNMAMETVYYINYKTTVVKVDFKTFSNQFENDIKAKYGKPSMVFAADTSLTVFWGQNWGQKDMRISDDLSRHLRDPIWGEKPAESPVMGCYLIAKCSAAGRSMGGDPIVAVEFTLFDGTPDYKYKQGYENSLREKGGKVKVPF